METFTQAPLPDNEERRLATLYDYELLDTSSEPLFDMLTQLAAHICATPIALIGLLDRDRQWFKASFGVGDTREFQRHLVLCVHTIAGSQLLEISDVRADERFASEAFVRNFPTVRFYAGLPLIVANGDALGTLCVFDSQPRVLTDAQRTGLTLIATTIVQGFEARRAQLRTAVLDRSDISNALLRGMSLELLNERLTTLTEIARSIFASLDPRALVDTLLHGVIELTGGGAAQLLARGTGGEFIETRDLLSRADTAVANDDFLRAAVRHDGVLIQPDGRRGVIQILAPSGIVAYLLDIRAGDRSFGASDAFAFGLLGQYLAVAIRNVELYRELASRRAAVIELNQVKNDLIAMLAHDFKGPLTTIVGLADVLAEDDRFDAESRQFLGMINSSAMRLAGLATDTLAISRLEQNELSLRFERVDVGALLCDIVRVFSVTRRIEVRGGTHELIVRADAARLRQVFENLIGNAIKYSPGGDMVDVVLRAERGGVEVAVRDRGIGVPPSDLGKLFGRFARGSNARELGIGGTGFGLYLARTIIEMHGGRITVESKEGAGSTFRVFVPTVPAPQRTLERRVLLLDSEENGRSFIAHTLRDEGYTVHPVSDEDELLTALVDGRYDAAIVDVDRLLIPAGELVERIAHRTTLVRLVSIAEPEGSGWNAALRKPFLIKDLQVVLESAVAERRRFPRE